MERRSHELVVNTVVLGLGQLVPKILALIVLPILTTYLTTAEYGNYDLVMSIAGLLIPIMTMQVQQAVFRYLLSNISATQTRRYISTSLVFIVLTSFILLPIVFVILLVSGLGTIDSIGICLLYLTQTFYNLLGQTTRGLGFNAKYSMSVVVYSFANMVLTVVLVAVFHIGFIGVIFSLAIAYLVSDIYMIITSRLSRHFSLQDVSWKALKQMLDFAVPIVPSSIALWVVNLSDRIIVIHFLGASANGIYAVANKIPTLYNTAYSVFNLAWTETAARVSDDGDPSEYYSKLFRVLYNFLLGSMLLMIPFTPIFFEILVKGSYGSAFEQVPILYFGVFFNSFVNFYSGIYIALKRTRQVGISSVAGAILNAVINIALISRYGLYAASFATAFSFFVIVVYRAYDLNKVIHLTYNYKEIIFGFVLFVISSSLIYSRGIIQVTICVIIAISFNALFNRSFIIGGFKMIRSRFKKQ